MRKIAVSFVVVSVLLLALPVVGQEEPGTLAQRYFVKVKPGDVLQFEEAAKRHMECHRQNNDPWRWDTWQAVSGEDLGLYVYRSPGHHWEDFDGHAAIEEACMPDWLANVAQHTKSISGHIDNYRPEVSRWPEGEEQVPLVSVVSFRVSSSRDFNYVIKKFHQAVEKTNSPLHYAWFDLVNGGEVPTLTLVLPHKNWADAKLPEKSGWPMMEEAYGRQEAEKLRKLVNKIILSESTWMLQYRADLSYIPGQ
jgi:hypothetical protein